MKKEKLIGKKQKINLNINKIRKVRLGPDC